MPVRIHNEPEIIRLISEGDERAFETYVMHYGPEVEKAIIQVTRSETSVKDIMQDVFLAIWMSREKLPHLEDPKTWLFRITYYKTFTYLKQHAKRTKILHAITDNEHIQETIDPATFEETKKFIHESIEDLPFQMKKVYTLSRNENLSINEIAQQLNIAPQTVKNTLSAALKNIRARLEQKGIIIPVIILTLSIH